MKRCLSGLSMRDVTVCQGQVLSSSLLLLFLNFNFTLMYFLSYASTEIYNYRKVMFIIYKFLLQFKFEHIIALTLSNMLAGLYFVLK